MNTDKYLRHAAVQLISRIRCGDELNEHDGDVLVDILVRFAKHKEPVPCKDCRFAERHCSDSVFGKPLYDCKHTRQIGREGTEIHPEDWFCADGVKRND